MPGRTTYGPAYNCRNGIQTKGVGGVWGVVPLHQERGKSYVWAVDKGMRWNCRRLGRILASVRPDLYRQGSIGYGLVLVLADGGTRRITRAAQLAPLLADSISMRVMKDGKVVSELPSAANLNTVLNSERFLSQFRSVDRVARLPMYLDTFELLAPATTTSALAAR